MDEFAVRVDWRVSTGRGQHFIPESAVEICVDIPAIAPAADCCWRGLEGEVNVRRHSRHMLAGRSDSLVIARSSDMAAVWLNVRCIASLGIPLILSHVAASQPVIRTPAPRYVRVAHHRPPQASNVKLSFDCKRTVYTSSTLYNIWLFPTHYNRFPLSQLASCRPTSRARCFDASLRTNQ